MSPLAAVSVEVCGFAPAVRQPASMILACADDGELAKQLDWATWTSASATATGVITWRSGAASLADSTSWSTAAADFTLTDPVTQGSQVLFARLSVTVTGQTPAGFQRAQAFDETPVPAAAGTGEAAPAPSSLQPAVLPAAASGELGYSQIEGYWDAAGGNHDLAPVAAAITGAESSFYPGIIQQGVDYCGSGSDKAGWGLWQITCGNEVPQYGTDYQLLNPWNNAEAAVYLFDRDVAAGFNGFTPWTTWLTGAFERFLQDVGADTGVGNAGEYFQSGSTPPGTPASPGPDPGSAIGPPMPGQPKPKPRPDSYQVSFEANTHMLAGYRTEGTAKTTSVSTTKLSFDPGTNPSSTQLSDGSYLAAFQAGNHTLFLSRWGVGNRSTPYGMDAGTSPSVAAMPTNEAWVAAFQTNNHHLAIYTATNKISETPYLMEPGTSPAIAAQPDGVWDVAFMAKNGDLALYDSAGKHVQTGDGMDTASSPAMAAKPGGWFEAVFEANNHDLAFYNTDGITDATHYGMDAGTSPSVASEANGDWAAAFQVNNHELGIVSNTLTNVHEIGESLRPGTSVSIVTEPDGSYEVAYEASNDCLGIYHAIGGSTNLTHYGMDAGTSPSLAVPFS